MQTELSVTSTLESIVERVDGAEDQVRRFARDAGFDDEDQVLIGLAAREMLVNAIKHGNRFDRSKQVALRLSRGGGRLTVEVMDEGDGFRLEDVPDPRAETNRERRSGRGLAMAMAIMDEVLVEKNRPRGTHIRMVKAAPDPKSAGNGA